MSETHSSRSPLYLAIDQGSHATRAVVLDGTGAIVASSEAALATHHPAEGWVEQDARELLESVFAAIDGVLASDGLAGRWPVAAGLATQRSSVVCWDWQTGKPLSPVLSWQDRRAADWLAGLELDPVRVRRHTGLVVSPHYGASKLRWCLDRLPKVRRALQDTRLCCGPLSSFVLFSILDERPFVVDPANAVRTLLFDLESRDWSQAMLEAFGIPASCLPRCVPGRHRFGDLVRDGRRIPLRVATGDQPAALFAAGAPDPGMVYLNLGTGAFVQRPVGPEPLSSQDWLESGLLQSVAWEGDNGPVYVIEGTVNGAGSALDWLAADDGVAVESLFSGAGGWLEEIDSPPLFINGVGGLGAPFWVSDCPVGFDREASTPERTVAVLESIVFLIQANLTACLNLAGPVRTIRATGGLSRLDGLCRRLADLSGLRVERPEEVEATARGLGWLLVHGDGRSPPHWREFPTRSFSPHPRPDLEARYRRWRRALESAIER